MNAWIDNLFTSDPMHAWLHQETDGLKKSIRTGELQLIYGRMFEEVK